MMRPSPGPTLRPRASTSGPGQTDSMDLAELFEQGGPLMWAILAASIVGVGVFLERLWSTQRSKVLPRAFVDRIRALVAKGKTNEALLLCEENASSIALVMAALGAGVSGVGVDAGVHALIANAKSPAARTRMPPSARGFVRADFRLVEAVNR